MTWPLIPLLEAVQDVSSGNIKIPQSEFLDAGALAVVDQGQDLVAGFTDETSTAVRAEVPLIVFGDHTRAIKYIDFPFAMGADGVKVLRPREGFDPKFLYRYLQWREVPSAGYSRHFKFLKELVVPRPQIAEQRRIAAILDHADALRAKRRQVLSHLDALAPSLFEDMFGKRRFEPVTAATLMPSMRNGVSPSSTGRHEATVLTLSAVTRGGFDPGACKAGTFEVDPPVEKRVTSRDFLMCRGNGNKELVGRGTFSGVDRLDLVFPDTVIAGKVDTSLVSLTFLEVAWGRREVRAQIEAAARTTNGTYKVNQESLGRVSLPVPPLELQQEFGDRVQMVHAQRSRTRAAADAEQELFAALQRSAFSGEL